MNHFIRTISFAIAITFSLSFMTFGQTTALSQDQSLDSQIRAEIAPFKGKVFVFAKNLDTGQTYSYNGDERVRTASTIKVAVMIEVFARVAAGNAPRVAPPQQPAAALPGAKPVRRAAAAVERA